MNISFFETEKWEKDYLSQRIKDYQLSFFEKPLTIENVSEAQDAEIISVFIYSKIDKAVLDKLPNLKLIATQSTGFDHINIEECKKRKIVVCNVPFYGENTVAEHTFALILSISRNIHKSYLRTTREDYTIEGLKGFDLKGRTIGVIGTGNIGEHVIRIAKGFEMNVLAFDVKQNSELANKLVFQYVSLEDLLKTSDIITLHVPHNEHTHHMISKENISLIKPGAVLINTARGGLIDTEALIEALDKNILSGVGLDVLEGEELIKEEKQLLYDPKKINDLAQLVKDHILLSRDNVVFTPHIAFYSQEALERILDTTIENINTFVVGKSQNTVQ